ncbi:MAG: PASTA domain-containing protein [Chitinophagaceae bacterium]|nr:PASTA domain-containing protein [Chitinophagaceae bacterium]MBP6590328.1 PASTA domain-containing protein [Chitinophagaceae bacterium]
MLKIITHRPLWVNILAGILLTFAIFFLFLSSLKCLTGHGKAATVPSVTGKTYEEAKAILKKAGFKVDIQDSIYIDTARPLTVMKQIPEADEVVKSNRTVFLLISRVIPPEMEMPNLVGYSFRNAEMVLKGLDLKVGDTTFKPDFATNAVLEQLYNGKQITPGTKIRKGSEISLVLGDGVGNKDFVVPDITGMNFCDARERLEEHGIIIGAVVSDPNVEDTCAAYIYKQNPERFDDEKRFNRIRSGQTMDVWLQNDKPAKDSTGKKEKGDKPKPKPRKPEEEGDKDNGYNK